MGRAKWAVIVLLVPFMLVAIGIQLAVATGFLGAAQLAWASQSRSSAALSRGLHLAHASTELVDRSLNSPAMHLYDLNPLGLGIVEDVRAWAHVVGTAGDALVPAGALAASVTTWDDQPPIVVGAMVDTARLPALVGPTEDLDTALNAVRAALDDVPTSGWLGSRMSLSTSSLGASMEAAKPLAGAARAAMPDLAQALGSDRPRYYLLCGLNDAELFGSGGAPLYAALIKADRGALSIQLSGQLESKLSPGNPPVPWDPVGGLPWYREGRQYPFVNSNFHPDFGIAAQDMRSAWAALGYPVVDGVVTVDLNALVNILEQTGPLEAEGFGQVTSDNVIRKVLVDSYREFGSQAVAERHARNDALAEALVTHFSGARRQVQALRGVLESIPPRHVQAGFNVTSLNAAVEELGATGTLADRSGDLIGAFSQSAPNKLSVFQERTIVQEVRLTGDGGAEVSRSVRIGNAVPPGLPGNPNLTRSYEALRARLRVAHRLPAHVDQISITDGAAMEPAKATGPFPDDRGGQVLWRGHEIPPREAVHDLITYRIPAGTFSSNAYEVWADPQAMTLPVTLRITVIPAPGQQLTAAAGWEASEGGLTWSGDLDRQWHLEVQ